MVRMELPFTPGPLTTSRTAETMRMRDLGRGDAAFSAEVRNIRAPARTGAR